MFTNSELQSEVQAALQRDARMTHPERIAVYADKIGSVTLRGSVGSLAQRAVAVQTARKVSGVINVVDQLKVHPRVPDRRADDELRAAALQRLIDDTRIPANHIDVHVSGGRVTLKGYVWRDSERAAVAEQIATLDGVLEVSDQIVVK